VRVRVAVKPDDARIRDFLDVVSGGRYAPLSPSTVQLPIQFTPLRGSPMLRYCRREKAKVTKLYVDGARTP